MPELQMVKSQPLFATPLLTFQIKEFEKLNQGLLSDIEGWRAEGRGIAVSNRLGWHSERSFFTRPEASFQELNKLIQNALMAAMKLINPKLDPSQIQMMMQGWVNVNDKGAFNTPHDHPDYLWSGCYYVQVPGAGAARNIQNSGDIEFLDPRGRSFVAAPNAMTVGSGKFRVCPEPGMMLLFPSSLMHWVYPHEDDEERVSVAFNMRITRSRRKVANSAS